MSYKQNSVITLQLDVIEALPTTEGCSIFVKEKVINV